MLDQTNVRSIDIIKKLRDALEIPKCVQILIFGKFAHGHQDAATETVKTVEHESPLSKLKIFNQIKKII